MSSLNIQPLGGGRSITTGERSPEATPQGSTTEKGQNGTGRRGVSVETRVGIKLAEPVFDGDRVAEIRAAIRDGTYPVVPTKIADAMIAARLFLSTGK